MNSENIAGHHSPFTVHSSCNIRRLSLEAFRNYTQLALDFDARPVVLVGENGAGKTSLLEAVSLLSPGRGLRGAALSELQNHKDPGRGWAISAQAFGRKQETLIGIGADREAPREKRVLRIDGKSGKSSAALLEHLSILWLTPDMDRMLSESLSERRKFMDRLVFVLDAQHRARVSRYEDAMRSRARILRDGPMDNAWLKALEDVMAREGIAIAAARKDWAERLEAHLPENPHPFPPVHVQVEGVAETLIITHAAVDAEEILRVKWKDTRGSDAASGTTEIGPHRSDLRVFHKATGMTANLCSSGEQKALLISLIFAEARLLKDMHGIAPLLLLDDITAHLDESRREALAMQILDLGTQAWLSGTDAGFFDALRHDAQFFTVHHGDARRMD